MDNQGAWFSKIDATRGSEREGIAKKILSWPEEKLGAAGRRGWGALGVIESQVGDIQ